MKKTICAGVLAVLLCGSAAAAAGSYQATARLRPDITIEIDGRVRTFYNVQGEEVHPISYADTTYLPIRSIGELMGKNVNWDAASNTASIGGARTTADATGKPDKGADTVRIKLTGEPNYTIRIDGTARTFYDANGRVCDPMVYNGSIYLPVRAIGQIMGKTVSWDESSDRVILSDSGTGDALTDFDTFHSSTAGRPSDELITAEQARQIACGDAEQDTEDVTFIKTKLERENGGWIYEIEFIVRSGSRIFEYDYEIDAATGRILDFDYDAENDMPAHHTDHMDGRTISEARAGEIALSRVPGATKSNLYALELDSDDGRLVYEGKIIYNGTEYEFTIEASSGAVLEWDVESSDD